MCESMMCRSELAYRRGRRWLTLPVAFGVLLGAVLAEQSSVVAAEQSRSLSSRGEPSEESRGSRNVRGTSRRMDLGDAPVGVSTGSLFSVYQDWHLASNGAVEQPPLSSYPSPKDSTVLFLHVFKCAGTTLREVFTAWAMAEGGYGSIVMECNHIRPVKPGVVCLNSHNELLDPKLQESHLQSQKVFAGHFLWGFQNYVKQPHLMVTTLRNPLELMVSAQQFMHRQETKTLDSAVSWITGVMESRTKKFKGDGVSDIGFIRRLVDHGITGRPSPTLSPQELRKFGVNAVENLESFWLVGVVEQYAGFLEVLQRMLDAEKRHPLLWAEAHARRENSSPVGSKDVLQLLDQDLTRDFNATLQLQWEVYGIALNLWDRRCREVVEDDEYEEICTVPRLPASYAL